MKLYKSLLILMGIALSLTSCNLPVDENALSTAVAATLQAAGAEDAPALPGEPDATAVVEGDSTPVPATSAPVPAGPGVLTVAYIDGGNIWFYQAGGTPVQLTTSGNAQQLVISQDGLWVAFIWYNAATDAYELRAVETSTASESVLLTQGDFDALYPLDGALHHVPYQFDFIPGSQELLLTTRKTFEGPGLVLNNDLRSIDVVSGASSALLAPGLGGDFYISPSGSQLALIQANTIGFSNVDGSARSPDHLTFSPVITYSEYQYYPIAMWTPDESGIVVVIPPEDPFISDTAQVWFVPVSGAPMSLVDLLGFSFFRNQGRTPMIAPDTAKAAFLRETAPNNFDLVLTPLDGSLESVIASGDITWQGWNPDSNRMVYASSPLNLMLASLGVTPSALGFGRDIRWVDSETYLFLDTLTATHRFGVATLPGTPSLIADISGQAFDYDFTQ